MATLEKTYRVAAIVELHVEDLLASMTDYVEIDETIIVTPFVNGREKGFEFSIGICDGRRSIFVAENRNSDEIGIVMHEGGWNGYDDVTEEDYKGKEFFKYCDHYKAAERVCKLLFKKGRKYGNKNARKPAVTA